MAGDGKEPSKPPSPDAKASRSPQRGRALGVLQRLARPKPKPAPNSDPDKAAGSGEPGPSNKGESGARDKTLHDPSGYRGGEGSATGFVGMLARRQPESDTRMTGAGKTPTRHAPLPMAREITPPDGIEVPAGSDAMNSLGRRGANLTARRLHIATPVMLTLAALLMAIGIWAVGALIYMGRAAPHVPADVHYPFLVWNYSVGEVGGFTPASQMVARLMLLCFPVALLLIMTALILRRANARRLRGRANY